MRLNSLILNNLTLCILFITLTISCQNKHLEISELIDKIYSEPNPYRNEEISKNVISNQLDSLLIAAKSIENQSIESIPPEERMNIKPYLIEGEIFASLREGYTSFTIINIKMESNVTRVKIEFLNDSFDKDEVWTDDLILIKEKTWKLDNVIYSDKKGDDVDLKGVLSSFIKGDL